MTFHMLPALHGVVQTQKLYDTFRSDSEVSFSMMCISSLVGKSLVSGIVDKRRPSTGNRIKLNLRSHSMHGNDESQRGIQVRPRMLLLTPQSTNLSEEFLLLGRYQEICEAAKFE